MKIQLIRNATLKLRFAEVNFLIDPFLAEKHTLPSFAGKSNNPTSDLPISVEEILQEIDYVNISHLHPDHFDDAAKNLIPKSTPILCQSADLESIKKAGFLNVEIIDNSSIIKGIEITRTNGQHGEGIILPYMGPVSGFIFKHSQEQCLYWLGDTIWYEEVVENLKKHNPAVVVCHAGGNKFFKEYSIFGPNTAFDTESLIMDQTQVLQLCNYNPDLTVIATHLGALDHETITRKDLRTFAHLNGIVEERLKIPENGEEIII
jgi:L-ascorbate metabolism protein UlaG (beta-lactamase superfamily)